MTSVGHELESHGLARLKYSDLCQGAPVEEAVLSKLSLLDPGSLGNQILERHVRLMADLVCYTLNGRFGNASVLLIARTLVALDYFLNNDDRCQDSLDGGFDDDLEEVSRVIREFHGEFEAFKRWKLRHLEDEMDPISGG